MAISGEIEQLCSLLDDTREALLEAVSGISDERLTWSPTPSASSVEAILRHLAEWESYFLSMILRGDGNATGRLAELVGRDPLLQKLGEVRARTLSVIRELGPDELDAARPFGGTVRQLLLRLLRHEHYHVGQINTTYLLLHPEETGKNLPPPPGA